MDDVLKRSLKFLGYKVKHVMNITDVGHLTGDNDSGEDKLEKGAKQQGKTVWDVAKEYEEQFWTTMRALNIDKKNITVLHATQCIDDMIKLIKKLEQNGHTYQTAEALYFDVSTFPEYGKLSGQKLEDKKQGARSDVHIDTQKKHAEDFALWFSCVKRFTNHTMHWDSPWGDGFPGWHIECSAMSMKGLDTQTIDIHTGGIDHIPVHHENEIAQSEGATGKEFVKWWVHHAFLQVNGQKMSKSKHNFYTLKDIEKKGIDPLALRYLFLQTHYRKPMNFTWEAVEGASRTLSKLRNRTVMLSEYNVPNDIENNRNYRNYKNQFTKALEEDLNTPVALSVLWDSLRPMVKPHVQKALLQIFDNAFGLGISTVLDNYIPDLIRDLANKREQARKNNDFVVSDKLRDQIASHGYTIEDNSAGYVIKRK